MGPTGTRIWRTILGLAAGSLLLLLPISGLTAAFKPLVYGTVAAVSAVGVLWAFKIVSRVTLLNAFTAGVVIVGLVAGSGIDGSGSLG